MFVIVCFIYDPLASIKIGGRKREWNDDSLYSVKGPFPDHGEAAEYLRKNYFKENPEQRRFERDEDGEGMFYTARIIKVDHAKSVICKEDEASGIPGL